jgi:hypothetical protein
MIYLFHGSDVEQVRRKAFAWVKAAQTKEPSLAYVRLAREDLSSPVLEEAISSGGLFVKRLLVVLDDPFPIARATEEGDGDEEEMGSLVEEQIDALVESNNVILIVAPKLLSAKAKKISAKAKQTYVFNAPAVAKRGFNASLPDALGARNREKLWLELTRALRTGDAPEMLHGLLHWKARQLFEQAKIAENSLPGASRRGVRVWKSQEARELSRSLIELLQASRRGGLSLALALERLALSI